MNTPRWLATASLVMLITACEAPDRLGRAPFASGSGADARFASFDAGGSVIPAHAPTRFGFGAEASAARVAAWDIDVRPDGAGLPAGSGSVAQGKVVYQTWCVACHGPTGTEGPNDRLVDTSPWEVAPTSQAIGNYWPYATTLFDYIRKAMPQTTPGILAPDQVYAVIAYLLWMNEIVADDAVMDAETLPAVVMPARDRFVPDDRIGGSGPVR
jgi:mono/diheme cytochrome c family protein